MPPRWPASKTTRSSRPLPTGLVPTGWRTARRIGTARHTGPFADVGHSDSIAHLRTALAPRIVHHSLDDLDAGDLRRRAPRRFTQEISRYVFEHGHTAADIPLSGIRYASRLGDELANWAIFEGTEPRDQTSDPIQADDPDLLRAMGMHGLKLSP